MFKVIIVATSNTKAEYIAAAKCVKEILYLKTMIEELLRESVNVRLKINETKDIIKVLLSL